MIMTSATTITIDTSPCNIRFNKYFVIIVHSSIVQGSGESPLRCSVVIS
jgi:hypothetical protein